MAPAPKPYSRIRPTRMARKLIRFVERKPFEYDIMRRTTDNEALLETGKRFMSTFPVLRLFNGEMRIRLTTGMYESRVGVSIVMRQNRIGGKKKFEQVGLIQLGFGKDSVIIESIQGEKGMVKLIGRANHLLQQPWANFIIRTIEDHARERGFKRCLIRKAETLHYYKYPEVDSPTTDFSKQRREIQKRMRMRIQTIAHSLGYAKERGFFAKGL